MRRRAYLLAFLFLVSIPVAAAMCPVIYTPPNSFVHLTDQTQGLVVYDEKQDRQRFVIRQAYEGVASDFGLVLPTPGKPNFTARSDQLFKQLHDMTKEPVDRDRDVGFGVQAQTMGAIEQDVQVIKTRNVGDFTATVLKADNADALVQWLNEHNYNFADASRQNFQYYIDKGGFYFTALKINVNEANCLTKEQYERRQQTPDRFQQRLPEGDGGTGPGQRCYLIGGLQPVEFRFNAENPMLPLRIMARPHDDSPLTGGDHENHDHKPGNFLIYTLAEQPLVIPGAKAEYAQRIGQKGGKLGQYETAGRFLVRQRFKFDARDVQHDLVLKRAAPFFVPREGSRVIEPDKTDTANGMIAFSGSSLDVSLTRQPSLGARLSYQTSKISHQTTSTVAATIETVGETFVLLGLLGGAVAAAPSLLLVLLFPIIFGLLWSRRKALKAVFFGIYGGTLLYAILFLLYISFIGGAGRIGESFMIFLAALTLTALPASFGGCLAFLTSHLGFKRERIRELQSRMEDLGTAASIGAVSLAVVGASLNALGILLTFYQDTAGSDANFLPVMLPFVGFPAVVAYTLQWLHAKDDVNIIELESADWKWFAVTLGALVLMVLTLSLLMAGLSGGFTGTPTL